VARDAAADDAARASARPLLDVSLAHYRAGRFRECLDAAADSARLDPRSAAAFNNAGICAARLELWNEALRHTLEALRLDPGFQLARNNLAWIRAEHGKAAAAREK
jgi:tetratricopeptide (TPR) repeat protein